MDLAIRDYQEESAACSLWLSGSPSFEGLKTASIGRFRCEDRSSGERLLNHVLADLHHLGFEFVVGPMDGNTWHNYRLVIESDGSPPFLMEPTNPPYYPEAFQACGFEIIASYESARVEAFKPRDVERYAERLERAGIQIRPFNLAQSQYELEKMYALVLETFAENFLYTPISLESFVNLYRPVLSHLDPDYVTLAEKGTGSLEAFLFAIPEFSQGPRPDQLIIKTYASRYSGLGGFLSERVQGAATRGGFKTIIHALMHSENQSKRNSEKYGRTFRRYALFGRRVGT